MPNIVHITTFGSASHAGGSWMPMACSMVSTGPQRVGGTDCSRICHARPAVTSAST